MSTTLTLYSDLDTPDASGWSAPLYNKTASFVYSSAYTTPVLELLAAKPGESIIDFGCGSGEVTLELQKIVGDDGKVVGVDFSSSMVNKAKEIGVEHVFVSDIQALEFPVGFVDPDVKFDAVFSNAALHWCKRDPKGVLRSAKRVLKEGGRFVGEMGGFMNCIGVRSAIHRVLRSRGYDPAILDPWYFPSVEEYRELLTSSSFTPTHLSLNPRITPLSTSSGLLPWLRLFVRNSFLQDFSEEEAEDIMKEIVEICSVDCKDGNGEWAMVYMRLRFYAIYMAK